MFSFTPTSKPISASGEMQIPLYISHEILFLHSTEIRIPTTVPTSESF